MMNGWPEGWRSVSTRLRGYRLPGQRFYMADRGDAGLHSRAEPYQGLDHENRMAKPMEPVAVVNAET